jgi:hypothetical protein
VAHRIHHGALGALEAQDGLDPLQRHPKPRGQLARRVLGRATHVRTVYLFFGRVAQRTLPPKLGVARKRLAAHRPTHME